MLIEGILKVDIFWILVHYISSIVYCIMIMMLMNRNVIVIMDINEKIVIWSNPQSLSFCRLLKETAKF